MYSAATAQSTMDYSKALVNEDVVDSPPNGRKRPNIVSSPSPLKQRVILTSIEERSSPNVETQRKLYDEEINVLLACLVLSLEFLNLSIM